jgi:hypothetical protein
VYRDPPEIAEIRRARARIRKRAGGTSDALFEYYLRIQDALKAAGIIAALPAKKRTRRARSGGKRKAA